MPAYTDILDLARKYRLTEFFPNEDLPYTARPIHWASPPELSAIEWLRIKDKKALCKMVELSQTQIEELINHPYYLKFRIPKKRGGSRLILAPERRLKEAQSRLNDYFQAWYSVLKPDEVHGFVRHYSLSSAPRGIISNALTHVGRKYVLNLDISEFFPSISAKQILSLLQSPLFRLNEREAIAITLLCTWNGRLPAGAPSSPALANFICLPLDGALSQFAKLRGMRYSRYADDLSFSADSHIAEDDIRAIRQIVIASGFQLNDKKQRLQSAGRRQTVTGLSVNEKVNLSRPLRRKIRAMAHDLETMGAKPAAMRHFKYRSFNYDLQTKRFLNVLKGYSSLLMQINGKQDPLARKINKLIKNNCTA
jgi:RNA-directed DNA polymerase